MKTISILVCILLLTFESPVFAGTSQCVPQPFKVEGNNIVLPGTHNPKQSVIYFFQNNSLQSLWIDHPNPQNRGASAGWASYLRSGNWSAIVLNKKNFSISCSTIKPGKVETLNCANVLSICVPQNFTTAEPLEGNYWLAEDKKWDNFMHALEKRGGKFNSPSKTTH